MTAKAETKQLNTAIPTKLDKELGFYCLKNSRKKKEVVEMALMQFLANKPQKSIIEN